MRGGSARRTPIQWSRGAPCAPCPGCNPGARVALARLGNHLSRRAVSVARAGQTVEEWAWKREPAGRAPCTPDRQRGRCVTGEETGKISAQQLPAGSSRPSAHPSRERTAPASSRPPGRGFEVRIGRNETFHGPISALGKRPRLAILRTSSVKHRLHNHATMCVRLPA